MIRTTQEARQAALQSTYTDIVEFLKNECRLTAEQTRLPNEEKPPNWEPAYRHSLKVAEIVYALCQLLHLPPSLTDIAVRNALLHDFDKRIERGDPRIQNPEQIKKKAKKELKLKEELIAYTKAASLPAIFHYGERNEPAVHNCFPLIAALITYADAITEIDTITTIHARMEGSKARNPDAMTEQEWKEEEEASLTLQSTLYWYVWYSLSQEHPVEYDVQQHQQLPLLIATRLA